MNVNKPLLVEFLGLPGSGKTTLVEAVFPELVQQGYVVVTKHQLHRWRATKSRFFSYLLLLRTPFLTFKHLSNLLVFLNSLDQPHKIGFKRLLLGILINCQLTAFAKEVKFDVMLLDQGSLQNLWSIAAFSTKFSEVAILKCIVDCCDLHDFDVLHVNINASPELAVSRINQRQSFNSRFDLMNEFNKKQAISNSLNLMNFLLKNLIAIKKNNISLEASDAIPIKIKTIVSNIKLLIY